MSTHRRHHHGHHEEAPHHHGHSHAGEDMLSVEDAYERVMASFAPLEGVEVPLLEALGQTLAEDITSPLALPPLANSGMDGYALQGADIAGASQDSPARLPVVGIVAAGQMPQRPVEAGVAMRIMTGAPVPNGADTVVPFEETDEVQRKNEGRPLDEVAIFSEMPVGANVRPAGEDIRVGELVLEAGTVVRAAEVGVLASSGLWIRLRSSVAPSSRCWPPATSWKPPVPPSPAARFTTATASASPPPWWPAAAFPGCWASPATTSKTSTPSWPPPPVPTW